MAVQIWTPTFPPADNTAIAAGIVDAGHAIGGSLANLAERMERKREADKLLMANAKAAETLYKNNPSFQKMVGKSPDEFGALSAHEKLATMQGAVTNLTLQQQQAEAARKQAEFENQQRYPAFAREMSEMGQKPEDVPFVLSPDERARRTAPPNLWAASARTGYRLPESTLDDLIRANSQPARMSVEDAINLARNPPSGFSHGQVTVSSTGAPGLTFTPQPVTPGPAVPIMTTGGQPTGKAQYGDKVIDLQAPNAEGKTLTQGETQMIQALGQAETDLDALEKMFKDLGADWGGPVSGRVKSAIGLGQNPNIAAVENAINAATPNLARGVFREVGVLTDEDIKRYKSQLPSAYDTDEVRAVKFRQLRERLKSGRNEMMDTLRKSGRDLSGFDKANAGTMPGGAPSKASPDLIEKAKQAIKSGKDPKAVKARFKELTGEDLPE